MSTPNTVDRSQDLTREVLELLADRSSSPQDAAVALATVLGSVVERHNLNPRGVHAVLDLAIEESAALRAAA